MAFKTSKTTGGTFLERDFMFVNSDNSFPNGYDDTTLPSNENKITASGSSLGFGTSVAVGSGKIVIGEYINNLTDIFDLDGNQLNKITASDGAADDRFGDSVAVGSGRICVGAYFTPTPGARGGIYIYDLDGNEITGHQYIHLER